MRLPIRTAFRGRLTRRAFWLRHLLGLPLALWAARSLATPLDLVAAAAITAWLASVWIRRLNDRGLGPAWLALALVPVAGAVWLGWQCGLRGSRQTAPPTDPPPDYATVRT